MAITHSSITVGTTPTLLCTIPEGNPLTSVVVGNADTVAIFLGDSSLSNTGADKGLRVATNANQQVWLHEGDSLYGVSAAGTAANAVAVLYSTIV